MRWVRTLHSTSITYLQYARTLQALLHRVIRMRVEINVKLFYERCQHKVSVVKSILAFVNSVKEFAFDNVILGWKFFAISSFSLRDGQEN